MLIGYGGNILETNIDAYVVGISGDAEGYVSSVEEIFVVPELFYLSAMRLDIRKFGVNIYSSRGMESEKEDFNIYVGDKYVDNKLQASLSLLERRIEISLFTQNATGRATEILDAKGNLVQTIANPTDFHAQKKGSVIHLDWTDDLKDPRDGLRLKSTFELNTSVDAGTPEYNVLSYGLTYYHPVLDDSTWAFHYFRSDADVQKEGNTNLNALLKESGAEACIIYPDSPACAAQIRNANNTINANRNGTAHPLGGQDRLRSYPNGRYQAAHTLFYGTELRWNFETSRDVVDLYFFNDVMQALQATFFWEQGTVSEEKKDLGKINRTSYGSGLRLVGGSGNTYRFEVSSGNEGVEVLLMFQYPWSGEME